MTSSRNVWILAADEPPSGWSTGLAGAIGISEVNPYAVTHDGNPVTVNNVSTGSNTSFFLNPPGGSVLSSNFDAYQPEADLDSLNGCTSPDTDSVLPTDTGPRGGTS